MLILRLGVEIEVVKGAAAPLTYLLTDLIINEKRTVGLTHHK